MTTYRQRAQTLSLWDDKTYDGLKTRQFRQEHATWGHSPEYQRWLSHPHGSRQRLEVLERQQFKCDYCNEPFDGRVIHLHHTSYENLGYEEASDLIAVHPECHLLLEAAKRREACGCRDP
jgi:5-methylcytosine-specific restriction endonuclease McrA